MKEEEEEDKKKKTREKDIRIEYFIKLRLESNISESGNFSWASILPGGITALGSPPWQIRADVGVTCYFLVFYIYLIFNIKKKKKKKMKIFMFYICCYISDI